MSEQPQEGYPAAPPYVSEPVQEPETGTETVSGETAPGPEVMGDVPQAPEEGELSQHLPSSAANESPVLPPSAAVAAAKAHALFGHMMQVARAAQAEIERWVPADVLAAAEREAALVVRGIL